VLRTPFGAFAIYLLRDVTDAALNAAGTARRVRNPSGYLLRKVTHIANMKAKTGVSDRGRVRSFLGGTIHRS